MDSFLLSLHHGTIKNGTEKFSSRSALFSGQAVTPPYGSLVMLPFVPIVESVFLAPRSPRSQLFDIQVLTPNAGRMNFCNANQTATIPITIRTSFISAPPVVVFRTSSFQSERPQHTRLPEHLYIVPAALFCVIHGGVRILDQLCPAAAMFRVDGDADA